MLWLSCSGEKKTGTATEKIKLDSPDLISVLMPAYNSRAYICESIRSVLSQTYTNFELIIIDDASTDGTAELIENFNDPRIILIKKATNSGIAATLNQAIELARGKYLARMDHDDICEPERLAQQHHFMEKHPEVIVCGSNYTVSGTKKKSQMPSDHTSICWNLLDNSSIAHPTAMFRHSAVKNLAIRYNPAYVPADDYKLWTELALTGKLHNLPASLLQYRRHDTQMSRLQKNEQEKLVSRIRKEYAQSLCGKLENIVFFTERPIGSLKDLQNYISIEKKLTEAFERRGIRISARQRLTRRKNYLIKSFRETGAGIYKRLSLYLAAGILPDPRLLVPARNESQNDHRE